MEKEKYEIVKFENNGISLDVNVSPMEETVWLTQDSMSLLFDRDQGVISRHINNIFKEGELDKNTSMQKMHKSQNSDNPNYRPPVYYNLDVIISVGYRVKSKNGIIFRRWANSILKQYLLKGYVINEDRLTLYESNINELKSSVEQINKRLTNVENKIGNNDIKELIFFSGEYFDARSFLKELFSKASKTIVLIDSYVDLKALDYLKSKKDNVTIDLFISSKSKLSKDDVSSFNKEYGGLFLHYTEMWHDRFIIIDDMLLYHLGTSLNYAGNKTFAITMIEDESILQAITKKIGK